MYKANEIAKKLSISTSTLRHYEAWGLIPEVPRQPNGYRSYTEEHLLYFQCIRSMLPGFGMEKIKEIMIDLQRKQFMAAILKINEAQASLYEERKLTEETLNLLENESLSASSLMDGKKWLTIGEVAKRADVTIAAIRYWEKMELISPEIDPQNRYRKFNRGHLRQILFIRSLKKTVYFLEVIKDLIKELEDGDAIKIKNAAEETLNYFDEIIKVQIYGIHSFYLLYHFLEAKDQSISSNDA